jgi:DNA-binding Lrp family transcriptional regulator
MEKKEGMLLLELLRDCSTSKRRLASLLNISPPMISYKLRRGLKVNLLEDIQVRVTPNFYGLFKAYILTFGTLSELKNVSIKFENEEDVSYYLIYGFDKDDILEYLKNLSISKSNLFFIYYPNQINFGRHIINEKIVKELIMSPRLVFNIDELSKKLRFPIKTINKYIKILKEKNLIQFILKFYAEKFNSILFTIFSRKPEVIEYELRENIIVRRTNSHLTFYWGMAWDDRIHEKFNKIKKIDKNVIINIYYNYSIDSYRLLQFSLV